MTATITSQAALNSVVHGAPILLLDTCSLLDVMRGPSRNKFGPDNARAALDLLEHAEKSPSKLNILFAEQASKELNDHQEIIRGECEAAVKKLENNYNRILEMSGLYKSVGNLPPWSALGTLDFPLAASDIVDRFKNISTILKEQDGFRALAGKRVSAARAPASQGKQSYKDCVIVETYLDFAGAARAAGIAEKMVFLSTNTADYTEGTRSQLHADLEEDFSCVDLRFESDIRAARYCLFPS